MGLASIPLSSTVIEREFHRPYSYVYTIVKDQVENGCFNVSYKENCDEIGRTKSRNQRYSLNFKGFLVYLIAAYKNYKVEPKTVNKITKNLTESDKRFSFFEYLNELGLEAKVNTLVNIALELQNQSKDITTKYLREYTIRKCYTDISEELSWYGISQNLNWGRIPRFPKTITQLQNEKIIKDKSIRLRKTFLIIIYELKEITENNLERMNNQIELQEQVLKYS